MSKLGLVLIQLRTFCAKVAFLSEMPQISWTWMGPNDNDLDFLGSLGFLGSLYPSKPSKISNAIGRATIRA